MKTGNAAETACLLLKQIVVSLLPDLGMRVFVLMRVKCQSITCVFYQHAVNLDLGVSVRVCVCARARVRVYK